MIEESYMKEKVEKKGWGVENVPYPKGPAFLHTRWDLCVGCGICEMACSMFHYGVINRELSRIRILKYLLPVSKAIQSLCVQCGEKERECEKACPVDPSVISFDEKTLNMKVDVERCLGDKCGKCKEACPANVPRFYPPEHNYVLLCDLCEKNGEKKPQCVEVCPTHALEFMRADDRRFGINTAHLWRIHPDEKAELVAKRLYPLPKDAVGEW